MEVAAPVPQEAPAPCDDHRPGGPDPLPDCGCDAVDRRRAPIRWLGDDTQPADYYDLRERYPDRLVVLGGPTTLYFKMDDGTKIIVPHGWWICDSDGAPFVSSAAVFPPPPAGTPEPGVPSVEECERIAYRCGVTDAAAVLRRVVFTKVSGLSGLKLTGPERDDWIVRTTARKTIAMVSDLILGLASQTTGGAALRRAESAEQHLREVERERDEHKHWREHFTRKSDALDVDLEKERSDLAALRERVRALAGEAHEVLAVMPGASWSDAERQRWSARALAVNAGLRSLSTETGETGSGKGGGTDDQG